MVSKQKKWFKSAFNDPRVSEFTPQKKAPHNVFGNANEADSIDLTGLDESWSAADNNNSPIKVAAVPMIYTDFKSSNWIENFAPRTKSDLAIHPKKLAEVEHWFESVKGKKVGTAPILLVNGPSGAGKTATIKALAKEFGYTISEWVTPLDIEQIRYDRNDNENTTFNESQIDKFSRFLFQSSRYRSVLDTSAKRLVLVEDFPNVFVKDPSSFEEVLQKYLLYGKSPLIFIITDTKSRSLNIGYSLFTDELRDRFKITSIAFNAVADTMLKNGLKRIQNIMTQTGFQAYYTEPGKDIIDSIVLSSQGDIRSAVINLHFASQKDSSKLEMSNVDRAPSTGKSTKKTKKSTKGKLKSLGTDENVSVLHTLGRVMNPKYQEQPDAHGNKQLLHSPDEIASLLATQPTTSLALIHHNYVGHFQRLEDILNASDALSCADVIQCEWRSDASNEISVNLAVRGVMISNELPVTGRWMPIRSAKNNQKPKSDFDGDRKKFGISMLVSSNILACDYKTFVQHIPLNSTE